MDNDAVSRDLATRLNLDDVTNNKLLSWTCDCLALASTVDRDLLVVLLASFELLELLFFHVVVSGCDYDDDANSKEDWSTFNPSMGPSIINDTYCESNSCCQKQNSEHKILKALHYKLHKSLDLS